MQSIKVLAATGAITVATIGGAYAAGTVNKNGHEVNDHAAHGQAVAAAARAKHLASATPTAEPSDVATADPTDDASDASQTATPEETTTPAEPTETATETAPAEPTVPAKAHLGWTKGQHKGWTKKAKHYGVAHGTGMPVKPTPTVTAHGHQPGTPTRGTNR